MTDTEQPLFAGAIINSPDPERLVRFYEQIFGGRRLPATGATANEIRWRTPGFAGFAPALTVRVAPSAATLGPLRVNDLGYAHLCFEADDVGGVVRRLLQYGGSVVSTFASVKRVLGIYARDPDGNVIEIHVPFPAAITVSSVWQTLGLLLRIKLGMSPSRQSRLRFIHVNVIVADWQHTVAFYQRALGAVPQGFERNYRGRYIGQLTGIAGAAVRGRHVALPGYAEGGPTLEVFTYNTAPAQGPLGMSDIGIVATEFMVHDIAAAAQHMVAAGARLHDSSTPDGVLLIDPDGNLIRLKCLDPDYAQGDSA